jgi:arabinogalactan endo-1,4-beta-galactosidase
MTNQASSLPLYSGGGLGWGLLTATILVITSSTFGATTQPTPFYLGADISALDAPYRGRFSTTRPYQENGKSSDELTILSHHGWNAFRLRVFVSPVRRAPNNTTEAAIPLAKKIKAAGALFLLDIHFSDTWADPQHQDIPVAWRNLSFEDLEKQWETYAHDTIKEFKDAGAMPDWVQVGNEITRGAAWPVAQLQIPASVEYRAPQPYDEVKQFDRLIRLLKAGIRGVKSAAGDTPPRIAIHIDQGGSWANTLWFFDRLEAAHVDYDIIAQSFYPPWRHGTLEQLMENMNNCAVRYNKDFLVAETGYGPNRTRKKNDDLLWPVTPQGRLQYMVDVVNTVRKSPRGIGVFYWAPERDVWNVDGSPGPSVFTMDHLTSLTTRPDSHAPTDINP